MRFRRIALAAFTAMAIAVPAIAVAAPASANSGNYWKSNDANHAHWNNCSIANPQQGNQPYFAAQCLGVGGRTTAFSLVGCVTVNGASWCLNRDSFGNCMNEVDNFFGNPNEQTVVASSCVAGDSHEEWHIIGVGTDLNILENRHTGGYLNIETQCQSLVNCSKQGTIHTTPYEWTWNTPGA